MKIANRKNICMYCIFSLADELFTLETGKVKEIKSGYLQSIYPPVDTLSSLAGRIYSEAESLPVLDLGSILVPEESSEQFQPNTIIIAETEVNHQKKLCGLLVDSCLDIIEIKNQEIQTTSLFGPYIKQQFISEKFCGQEQAIKILDLDALWENCESLLEE